METSSIESEKGQVNVEVSVPSCAIGLVLGKDRKHLLLLQQEEGIQAVRFRKNKGRDAVLIVEGSKEAVENVVALVRAKVETALRREAAKKSASCTKEKIIPSHAIGCVIQREGAGLRFLRESEGICDVELTDNGGSLNEKVLRIWATNGESLANAVSWVERQCALGDKKLRNKSRKLHSNEAWKPGAFVRSAKEVHKLPKEPPQSIQRNKSMKQEMRRNRAGNAIEKQEAREALKNKQKEARKNV